MFLVPGFLIVFTARKIVDRYKLGDRVRCDFEHEMNEDELRLYKYNKAVVNLKMLGMLIALPGIILVVLAFR